MKLLIADDHNLVRDALVSHITRDNPDTIVLEAASFDEAYDLINTQSGIDLVLLDICMPGMGDLSVVTELTTNMPKLPVALISGTIDPDMIEKTFACGARGFIPKTIHGKALLSVLQLIISGEKYIPDILLQPRQKEDDNHYDLSVRELQVLEQLVQGQPNKRIAQRLHIEETTVKLHLRSIFRKLKVHNRTEAVILAIRANIVSH